MGRQAVREWSASVRGKGLDGSAISDQSADRLAREPIAVGARFRLSPLGAARCPRLAKKEGSIVGYSRVNSSIRVRFDGSKTSISLHRDYVEQLGC
jgi:hypothetical protein